MSSKNLPTKFHYIECECDLPEHTLRFSVDESDNEKCLVIETRIVNYMGLFGRLKYAFRYVFGLITKYGPYDCTLINKQNAFELIRLCEMITKQRK